MLSFWSEKSFQQGQQCAGDRGKKKPTSLSCRDGNISLMRRPWVRTRDDLFMSFIDDFVCPTPYWASLRWNSKQLQNLVLDGRLSYGRTLVCLMQGLESHPHHARNRILFWNVLCRAHDSGFFSLSYVSCFIKKNQVLVLSIFKQFR